MKGSYKKFDQQLHKENDAIAKKLTSKLVKKLFNLDSFENTDKYGVDLWLLRNNEIIAYAESEIKLVWNTASFPYPSVQFPERKGKFAKLDKPTLFVMINGLKNRALTVWSKDLITSPLVEVPNKYKAENELFYQVSLNLVKFYDIIG